MRMLRATANSSVHFLGLVFHIGKERPISHGWPTILGLRLPSNSVLLGGRIALIRLPIVCLLGNDEFNSHFPWDSLYRLCNHTLPQNRKIP